MHTSVGFRKLVLAGAVALAALASFGTAHAGVTRLYAFQSGRDGAIPQAGVIEDAADNLYGTTSYGGGHSCYFGCGTVFRLAPDGKETVLHAFTDKSGDGAGPDGSLIRDSAGNLYGTASQGGTNGGGIVFKLAPDGTETVLHSFAGGDDGENPQAGLIADEAGNLYGTASNCGNGDGCFHGYPCCGIVFKLAPDGTYTVLTNFAAGGAFPVAALIRDKNGNLYGTTSKGGITNNCYVNMHGPNGCGVVFKLAPDGTETVLYEFTGENGDGAEPYAGVIEDKAGNLYGTTGEGGIGCEDNWIPGCGTVFKLAPDGTETVLYAFRGGRDGAYPDSGLIRDEAGNLYGTTYAGAGGGPGCQGGCGTVFKLAPDGTETVLYAFSKHHHQGEAPQAGLMQGGDGELYGTASAGGVNCELPEEGCGTVFEIEK